ncbi:MAG TPA: cupin domain-containing protein [Candidatus Dormibacteraeota bacterium]|nr:cupin domain-containing protein [Candidatus Dormibacteraeota bacterium]
MPGGRPAALSQAAAVPGCGAGRGPGGGRHAPRQRGKGVGEDGIIIETGERTRRQPFAPTWDLAALQTQALAALRAGGQDDAKLIDGRILAVKASPMLGNSSQIVVGTACLPPGFATRAHSHEAEEVSMILAGSGRIEIDGVAHPVSAGTIVLTPANAVHVTHSEGSEPLVVLWFYAPPGSEARWVEPDKHETAGHAKSGRAGRA